MINITVLDYLKQRDYVTVSSDFYTLVNQWRSWYQGEVESFHRYKIYNGNRHVKCRRATLGMAKKLCEDWANLLMNERVQITIKGEEVHDFVHSVLNDNNFWVKINEAQEIKAAVGAVAYIPRACDVETKDGAILSGKSIKINYVAAESIFPLSWENGEITECAFASSHTINGNEYLYLQMHTLEPDGYVIENIVFSQKGDQISELTEVSELPLFRDMARTIRTGDKNRQFVIDRLNIANNVDTDNPMGISVYANAIDLLKGMDLIYDSYLNEFVLGKKRIMVKSEAAKFMDGEPVFDDNDVIFYQLPQDLTDEQFIKEIDMNLRTTEHQTGIRDTMNTLASKCGFGENYYRFDNGNIATATQVISENSTLFRVLKKHEIILERVLKELIQIVVRIGNQVLKRALKVPEAEEITIDFDDSIIEDKQTELTDMCLDVAAGLLRAEIYLAKKYGVSEEEALKLMPDASELFDERERHADA